MQTESYTIKAGVFEGPFGLLIELIEGRKLFINDLSLSQVTEDYLNHINKMRGTVGASQISSFIVVAATLILLKSKSLLPGLSLTESEEKDIKSLEERLRLYQLFTKLSMGVKSQFGDRIIFPAEERKKEIVVFLPDSQITCESMMTFAKNILGSLPQKTFLPNVEVKKVISLEEMITRLTGRIQNAIELNFRDLVGKGSTREEKVTVIVGFLAMLELVRQGILDALQEGHGEDIIIKKQ